MPVTYLDAVKSKNGRVSNCQLASHFRFYTLVADFLTGVVERRESETYNTPVIKKWLEDSPSYVSPAIKELIGDWRKVELKVATRSWRANVTLDKSYRNRFPRKFLIEGSPGEIIDRIESVRGWPTDDRDCHIQYLRYKSGQAKLTVAEDINSWY